LISIYYTNKTHQIPKLIKTFKTSAEEAGLPSNKEMEKRIEKVSGLPKPPKATKKSAEAPEPQVIYVQMAPPKKERKKRVLTDEQKDALRERLVKAREAKQAKRAVPKEE